MSRISLAASVALVLFATRAVLGTDTVEPAQFAARLSPDELKIETALDKPITASYREAKFNEVIADLAKQSDLRLSLDPEGMDEAGVVKDQLVSLELGTIGLRQTFEVLLSPLHLTFVPDVAGLVITSEEACGERPMVRVYPVADLIRVAEGSGEVAFDYDTLIDTITSHLSPDSWTDNGGPSSIQAGPAGCLIAAQTYETHREIDQLIVALRRLKSDHAGRKGHEAGSIVDLRGTRSIRDALAKRDSTTLDIEFKFYVQDVAKLIKTPIVLDPEGLEEAGIDPDQMIHVTYRDARIGNVFRETLAKLQLGYVVKEGYVMVTSREKESEIGMTTRLYPVADLAPVLVSEGPVRRDLDSLIGVVTFCSKQVGIWSNHGGSSSITGWSEPAALIVTATDETHDDVEQLLAKLRAADVAEFNAEVQEVRQRIVERVYPLYTDRRIVRARQTKEERSVDDIPTADEVAKLIHELLPDASWQDPDVLLRPFHDRLIIRQRRAMHDKIESLLQKLDAWPAGAPAKHPLIPQGAGGGFF